MSALQSYLAQAGAVGSELTGEAQGEFSMRRQASSLEDAYDQLKTQQEQVKGQFGQDVGMASEGGAKALFFARKVYKTFANNDVAKKYASKMADSLLGEENSKALQSALKGGNEALNAYKGGDVSKLIEGLKGGDSDAIDAIKGLIPKGVAGEALSAGLEKGDSGAIKGVSSLLESMKTSGGKIVSGAKNAITNASESATEQLTGQARDLTSRLAELGSKAGTQASSTIASKVSDISGQTSDAVGDLSSATRTIVTKEATQGTDAIPGKTTEVLPAQDAKTVEVSPAKEGTDAVEGQTNEVLPAQDAKTVEVSPESSTSEFNPVKARIQDAEDPSTYSNAKTPADLDPVEGRVQTRFNNLDGDAQTRSDVAYKANPKQTDDPTTVEQRANNIQAREGTVEDEEVNTKTTFKDTDLQVDPESTLENVPDTIRNIPNFKENNVFYPEENQEKTIPAKTEETPERPNINVTEADQDAVPGTPAQTEEIPERPSINVTEADVDAVPSTPAQTLTLGEEPDLLPKPKTSELDDLADKGGDEATQILKTTGRVAGATGDALEEGVSIGSKILGAGGMFLEALGPIGDLAMLGSMAYGAFSAKDEGAEMLTQGNKLHQQIQQMSQGASLSEGSLAGATLNTGPSSIGASFPHF